MRHELLPGIVTGSSCEVEYVELQPAGHDARTGPAYQWLQNSSSVILGIGELSFNAFHNIIHVTRKRDGEIAVRIGKDTPAGCQALPEDRIHLFQIVSLIRQSRPDSGEPLRDQKAAASPFDRRYQLRRKLGFAEGNPFQ